MQLFLMSDAALIPSENIIFLGIFTLILMKCALELLPRMGEIKVPHFPRDTNKKYIIFFSGLLTETSSSVEVGKGSDQKHLLNRGGEGV